ncbi:MAG: PQQ-binding-like beta-propeller repeat protein [Acidimicrobiales bacterium]
MPAAVASCGERELAGGGSFGLWGRPPGPIAAGDIVVLPIDTGGTTTIIGVDATTGAERWRVDPASIPGTSGTLGPIANTEDMTILATDHTVTGLDRRTGTTRWTIPFTIVDSSQVGVSRATSAVATSDTSTMIVLPTIETPEPGLHPPGSLPPTITYLSVAIDTEDGTERWRAPVLHHPAAADGTVVGYIYEASPPPTIDAPVSLPPMRRPVLQALDADDGTTLWTAAGAPTYGDLWPVGDGIVITTVGTDAAGRTTAYDLRSGAVRWEQPIDPGNYLGAPQAIEGHRSFLLGGGRLSALDTATGSTMWSTATPPGSLESYLTADRARVLVSFNTMPWRD